MNGNYGDNANSTAAPVQPTPIIQALPYQSNTIQAPSFAVNVTFQAPQQQFQSIENCFPGQNTLQTTSNNQNPSFCVNQNGSTFVAFTPIPGVQCVQPVETPQGIQLVQMLPQALINPELLNLNSVCVQSALIPQQYVQTQDANFQTSQLILSQHPTQEYKSNIQPENENNEEGTQEEGNACNELKIEPDSVVEERSINKGHHDNQNILATMSSLSTSMLPQNNYNEMLQQMQGNSGIINTAGGMNMPHQIFYTNCSDQQNFQSFQILVPTSQGMSLQTVMACYPSQLVTPLVNGMLMNGSPAIPQFTQTVPQVTRPAFTQQAADVTTVAAPIPSQTVIQVKTVTSPSNASPGSVSMLENLPQAPTMVSTVPGPTSPQLPDSTEDLCQPTIKQSTSSIVDGIDLEEIREFARTFKMRRLVLGLTQTQVGQALSVTEGPAYSQSAICRFEKLDITPRSAAKIRPVLERWLKEAEEKYQQGNVPGWEYIGLSAVGKIRKRRTFFSSEALAVLNARFDKNSHPPGREVNNIASEIGYDRDTVRVWFCNKRQSLRHTASDNTFHSRQRVSHLNPVNPSTSPSPSSSTSCSPLPS